MDFEDIMQSNGYVPYEARDAADAIVTSINAAAAKIGAPPAFYAIDGGYQMHPELHALLKANPEIRDRFFK